MGDIRVQINRDIIRLFSEGLYRSPHKAIEELVTNGYDADARGVHVLLPSSDRGHSPSSRLWVVDNGHGMDEPEFHQLWCVADSNKGDSTRDGRKPIGQFGIGKLAAYVLAWRLSHISLTDRRYLRTTMNFRAVRRRQSDDARPVVIKLTEVSEDQARTELADIEHRDSAAWALLFGRTSSPTWTAACLTDFKDLYGRLHAGRLKWVLSTGLPLHGNFSIHVDGERLTSSKESGAVIDRFDFQEDLPKIGRVRGTARICEKALTRGKSQAVGRSHGYFVSVRDRVINLDDPLFGTPQPNHAAWSRFALDVHADGLRPYLLSSREGVRDCSEVEAFRDFLRARFNRCRQSYEEWNRREEQDLDIDSLLNRGASTYVSEPVVIGVRSVLRSGDETYYIDAPSVDRADLDLARHESQIAEKPVTSIDFGSDGPRAASIRYQPVERHLIVNSDHPFIDKLTGGAKRLVPGQLFATAELLLEGQLHERCLDPDLVANLLADRDRVLRILAGEAPPTALEVLRLLKAAEGHSEALEHAVGRVFHVLGFEYERQEGAKGGPDGSLFARLGRIGDDLADYRLVYDTKQTRHPRVPAGRIDVASLDAFRRKARADYGFFVATGYEGTESDESVLRDRIEGPAGSQLTLLTTGHLRRLLDVHFRHGVTLTDMRNLFERARTTTEVDEWIGALRKRREEKRDVPVALLLRCLEDAKSDEKAVPNIKAVRQISDDLREFSPDHLIARLRAAADVVGRTWLEVKTDGDVVMRQTANEIVRQMETNIGTLDASVRAENT